jgi:Tfp pilus assembly protein PilO
MPKYEGLSSLDQEIFEKDIEFRSQEEYIRELEEIAKGLNEKEDEILKIDSALPQGSDIPDLLNFLQKTASQSGLMLEKVTPRYNLPGEGEKLAITQINFVLNGDYSNFKDFLSVIEKSARLIEVDTIGFSYPTRGGPFNFNVGIKAYSYHQF